MRMYVGITDYDWYRLLPDKSEIDEVNFWTSSPIAFKGLNPGEIFLFKLNGCTKAIVGGGFFSYSSVLPMSLAWDAFKERNGVSSLAMMRRRIERFQKQTSQRKDHEINCIVLADPFFFPRDRWIDVPADWNHDTPKGRIYDTDTARGMSLWEEVLLRLQIREEISSRIRIAEIRKVYGEMIPAVPQLGSGGFLVRVADAYERRCAATGERTLPALQAMPFKPFSQGGPYAIENGILLRADISRLFSFGYVTVSPEYRIKTSKRIKREADCEGLYSELENAKLFLPQKENERPNPDFIAWHNANVFLG